MPVGGVHDPGIPRPGAGSRYPDVPPALPPDLPVTAMPERGLLDDRRTRRREGSSDGLVAEPRTASTRTRTDPTGRVGPDTSRHEAGTGRAVDDLSGAEQNGWTTRAVP